jgi:Mlc titration factor MtfA (ptsG expression regulator)
MGEVYAVLFSWALTLSGYPLAPQPEIVFKPHQYFVDTACKGSKNCMVIGWFSGGDVVYIDDNIDINGNQIAASIVVHEYAHYLQYRNGEPHGTCKEKIELERKAYGIQKEYLLKNGVLANGIGLSVNSMNCVDK